MEFEVIKWTWATPRRVTTPLVQKKALYPGAITFLWKAIGILYDYQGICE